MANTLRRRQLRTPWNRRRLTDQLTSAQPGITVEHHSQRGPTIGYAQSTATTSRSKSRS